uniref:E3 ubiquitin-protein ligase n=1 Tax=Anisakis simplex TaxID=6269 RepID=A0A0M3JXR0_ANISI
LQKSFEKLQAQCPTCRMWYGVPRGNQPLNAHMHVEERRGKIPGFENCKSYFEIFYNIPSGIQTRDHPRPGNYYHGTSRTAYLPNNEQGQKVLELFKLAFRYRLMFTVGDSVTTGRTDVVVWNSIHNKTSVYGGPQKFVCFLVNAFCKNFLFDNFSFSWISN